jgi:hypothetical protein
MKIPFEDSTRKYKPVNRVLGKIYRGGREI